MRNKKSSLSGLKCNTGKGLSNHKLIHGGGVCFGEILFHKSLAYCV